MFFKVFSRTALLCTSLLLAACIEGPKGDTGPEGPPGPKGDPGVAGIQGEQGIQGPAGASVEANTLAPDPAGPCPNGGTQFVVNGAPVGTACNGAQGAPGPQGPQGITFAASTAAPSVVTTGGNWAFALTPVQVDVTTGQKVIVTAFAAFGTFSTAGANDLDLAICSQSTAAGAAIVQQGSGSYDLSVNGAERSQWGLTHVIPVAPLGIAAGTYRVGLCIRTNNANWTNNEWGSTTVVVTN